MSARSGMANLISRLRVLADDKWATKQETTEGDGSTKVFWLSHQPNESGGTVSLGGTVQTLTTDYTWDTTAGRIEFTSAPADAANIAVEYRTAQFTDDYLEDKLDKHVTFIRDELLLWDPETIGGGTIAYHDAHSRRCDFEEADSGTVYWAVRDSIGTLEGTANYTRDYLRGYFRWTNDKSGTSFYLTARSYDINAAAADLWMEKAASASTRTSFTSEFNKFERQQYFDHCIQMAHLYEQNKGQNRRRGIVSATTFVRTDLNPSYNAFDGSDNPHPHRPARWQG